MTKLSLRMQMISAIGLTILLFGAVIAIYQYSVSTVRDGYSGLISNEIAIARHADGVLATMLQCRRDEKDFMLRMDMKYVASNTEDYKKLVDHAEAIIALAEAKGDRKTAAAAQKLIDHADTYHAGFLAVVDGYQTNGLTEEDGLQGAFRDTVHEVMADLEQYQISDLAISQLMMRRWEKDFHRTNDQKYRDSLLAAIANHHQLVERPGLSDKFRADQRVGLQKYESAIKTFIAASDATRETAYNEVRAAAQDMEQSIDAFFIPEAGEIVLMIRRHEKDYLLRRDSKYVERNDKTVASLKAKVASSGIGAADKARLTAELDSYTKDFHALVAQDAKNDASVATMRAAVHQIEPAIEEFVAVAEQATQKTADTSAVYVRTALIVAVVAVGLALFLAIAIPNSITSRVNIVTEGLLASSSDVSSASQSVASASQQLAASSTEQASNIEETSSAMEEMASMAGQNAEYADTANKVGQEARKAVHTGTKNLDAMVTSMAEIEVAFNKVSKIVRSIEEIAFQTNLLSLNASLEAAGAGEHGKRFAVVADEVRNLSLKAEEAARETVQLITDASERVGQGSSTAETLHDSFAAIETSSDKISSLLAEIQAASREQARGADQVGRAMVQLDQTTQGNASAAEETAASAEELSAQSSTLNDLMDSLHTIIMGAGTERKATPRSTNSQNGNGHVAAPKSTFKAPVLPAAQSNGNGKSNGKANGNGKAVVAAAATDSEEGGFRQF